MAKRSFHSGKQFHRTTRPNSARNIMGHHIIATTDRDAPSFMKSRTKLLTNNLVERLPKKFRLATKI